MSGLAIFGLKIPSLLQVDKLKTFEPSIRRTLKTLYGVNKAPSDTILRERLDTIKPNQLRRGFKQIFAKLQRGKELAFLYNRYYNGYYRLFIYLEDIMISIDMLTPQEMLKQIASRARAKRLFADLSQQTLSAKSGVSYGVLKKFEATGKISLGSLLKLAVALGALGDFEDVFAQDKFIDASLDELIQDTKRKRGRK